MKGDQAASLRNLVRNHADVTPNAELNSTSVKMTRIVTVTSGKGGVGKSNFSLNFALSLQSLGYKVVIFDADLGFANIEVLMGTTPRYNLYHLLSREKTIWDIIQKGPNGLEYISGGSGFNNLIRLTDEELNHFTEQMSQLNGYADFIIFDTGAGLSKETLKFIVSSHDTIIVTTPEPTSITDAYAVIKMVHSLEYQIPIHLVVNRVMEPMEGKNTSEKIDLVSRKFLNMEIQTLGYVVDDKNVSRAVKKQIPFTIAYPNSPASKTMTEIAHNFLYRKEAREMDQGSVKSFINRMLSFLN